MHSATLKRSVRKAGALALFFTLTSMTLQARVFTDLDGRQVEAEIAGVRKGKVVLNVNGNLALWPLDKLIEEDRKHIAIWALNRPATKIVILTNDKDAGSDITTKGESNTREDRRTFEINLYNQTYQDSGPVSVKAYVFVRMENGTVAPKPVDFQLMEGVYAREHVKLTSQPIAIQSSKTVTRTTVFGGYREDGSIDMDTRKSLTRKSQDFEGIWVRVYSKGRIIGEAKKISVELERDKQNWPG